MPTQNVKTKRAIYGFFSAVILWSIVCFIVWFLSARILNIPLIWLAKWILGYLSDGVIDNVTMHLIGDGAQKFINQQLIIHTNIPPIGTQPVYSPTSPLIYGYGLALFSAMTFATPKDEEKKWRDIAIAYIVFLFVQLFGISNKAFIDFVWHAPPAISDYFPLLKAHQDILGASYQIATLVLPPVTPLVLWISFNTAYMEQLVGHRLIVK